MGQGRRHLHLCDVLYKLVRAVCVPEHTVGADQFVYFDAANPKRCLAPDAFVTLGVPDHDFDSYLVWEEGTPTLAFEVLSPSDTPERWTFEEKLRRYRALGVRELVTFHVDAQPGERLRVWDRLEHDLVERVVVDDRTPCLTLGLTLLVGPALVAPDTEYPITLRVARDAEGGDLFLTTEERVRAERAARELESAGRAAEAAGRAAEAAGRASEAAGRAAEAAARQRAEERAARAEARIAELEQRALPPGKARR